MRPSNKEGRESQRLPGIGDKIKAACAPPIRRGGNLNSNTALGTANPVPMRPSNKEGRESQLRAAARRGGADPHAPLQ